MKKKTGSVERFRSDTYRIHAFFHVFGHDGGHGILRRDERQNHLTHECPANAKSFGELGRVRFHHAASLIVRVHGQNDDRVDNEEEERFFDRQVFDDEHVQTCRLAYVPHAVLDGYAVHPA